MSERVKIANDFQIRKRKKLCQEFYDNILNKTDKPLFVTDEASIYDLTMEDDDVLLSKIFEYYGIKLLPQVFKEPFWKLVVILNRDKNNL